VATDSEIKTPALIPFPVSTTASRIELVLDLHEKHRWKPTARPHAFGGR